MEEKKHFDKNDKSLNMINHYELINKTVSKMIYRLYVLHILWNLKLKYRFSSKM